MNRISGILIEKEQIRLSRVGKKMSKESKLKISLSTKGKAKSEETKFKMRLAKQKIKN